MIVSYVTTLSHQRNFERVTDPLTRDLAVLFIDSGSSLNILVYLNLTLVGKTYFCVNIY